MEQIPKIIHYCWFGNGEMSKLMKRCIASWHKFFPDYEIKEWNETNFDVYQNAYCREAYQCKKWAFVSDYARLAIIYKHGGIYFDTDVEVLKPFDHILNKHGYLCFQNPSNKPLEKNVNTGTGFAAAPGDKVIEALMHDYNHRHFIINGEMDVTPCTDTNTVVLENMGLITDGSMQRIGEIMVYPYEYFTGFDIANSHPVITDHTYTIHHYEATWKEPESLWITIKYKILVKLLQKIVGYSNYDKIKKKLKG